jgi:hypothetical protein
MKTTSLSLSLFFLFLLSTSLVHGRNPYNSHPAPHYKSEQSGCNIPVDQFDLDINDVRARLLNAGDLWWDLTSGHYEVPKRSLTATSPAPQAIFAGSIWFSALDQGNNLKMAALEYRQGTSDFFTGPLDHSDTVTLSTCNLWDQHFRILAADIRPCLSAYQPGVGVPAVVVNAQDSNMIRWPGKGNPYLAAEGYDMSGILAPFYDANGDGIYNPLDGDYPSIKQGGFSPAVQPGATCDSLHYQGCTTFADEMIFWVMNDKGNVHTASNGAAIGIQVNALAFAFQDVNIVNDMTFYTYNVINKSGATLNRAYFSQFTDVDLGCANNDRVGCDTSRNLAIAYNGFVAGATQVNGITADQGSVCPVGEVGYGTNLPMLGVQMLEGAIDTAIDISTGQNKKLGMSSFCYFTNGVAAGQSDPTTAAGYRNYQKGFWNDGSPITYGGTGYNGSTRSYYTFPGDPSISSQWSECNQQTGPAIAAGDRRFVQTSGPFTFLPCSSQFFTLAVLFVQPPGGVQTNCPSWSIIGAAADTARALFDGCFVHRNPLLSISDVSSASVKFYPNPVSDLLYFTSGTKQVDEITVYDLMGRKVLSQSGSASSLDMSSLTGGVYLVKTNTETDQAFKIVKR